jgi:hypothetical protein
MKVLMDGGSSINILSKDAFEKLNVRASKQRPSHSLFHGIVLGGRVTSLSTINQNYMKCMTHNET